MFLFLCQFKKFILCHKQKEFVSLPALHLRDLVQKVYSETAWKGFSICCSELSTFLKVIHSLLKCHCYCQVCRMWMFSFCGTGYYTNSECVADNGWELNRLKAVGSVIWPKKSYFKVSLKKHLILLHAEMGAGEGDGVYFHVLLNFSVKKCFTLLLFLCFFSFCPILDPSLPFGNSVRPKTWRPAVWQLYLSVAASQEPT